ncbi:MAG: hypothetical protein ACTSUQ_11560 [Candidatus Freyarchaeota archaeon]
MVRESWEEDSILWQKGYENTISISEFGRKLAEGEIHSWTGEELLIRMKRHGERPDETMTLSG